MTVQEIATHIAALLAGVGVAYTYLVHLVGYVHPEIAALQAIVARLESRLVPAAPTPTQPPQDQAAPTQAPAGAPKAA